jgi:hypothetical protein
MFGGLLHGAEAMPRVPGIRQMEDRKDVNARTPWDTGHSRNVVSRVSFFRGRLHVASAYPDLVLTGDFNSD